MESNIQTAIDCHREQLESKLCSQLETLVKRCGEVLDSPAELDALLSRTLNPLTSINDAASSGETNCIQRSHLIYVIGQDGTQLSSNISHQGVDHSKRGRSLGSRPYMHYLDADKKLVLTPVYIDANTHRPCLSAIHKLVGKKTHTIAYLMADFDLAALPDNGVITVSAPNAWRQIKGDPAIRGQLFQQERVTSAMDENLVQVNDIITDLICERGVFHAKLHYSSSRATLWLYDQPHRYRLHVLNEIISPDVCLLYPLRSYPETASVTKNQVREVLEHFRSLRDADQTIYLRSASVNIINAMVGLTFSCDGSHYMPVDEFLDKPDSFWFGCG